MTAYKNRVIREGSRWKEDAIFVSLLLLLVSILVSRAVLSSSLILFLILTIVNKDFVANCKRIFSQPSLLCLGLLFFLPLLSGLWSEDKKQWLDVVRLKLPLIALPLAFAGSWHLTNRQWRWIAFTFLSVVFAGCAWSLVHYALHAKEITESYLKAKSLLTPLENDHVRFSWLVAVAIIGCAFFREFFSEKTPRVALLLLGVFFIVYLHILSARTGLFSLYLFLLLYAGWFLVNKKRKKLSLFFLALCVSLPLLAYYFVPTFQARLRYFIYDSSFVKKGEYLPGTNDGARTMSLKAGWQVLKQNPFGVGAGDIMHEANKWYAANVPQVLPTDKFYPSSEWLIYGAIAGWPGALLFTICMLLPFVYLPPKHRIYWVCFHATAAASFLFDMGLEVQYGIFLYGFLACLCWKITSGK